MKILTNVIAIVFLITMGLLYFYMCKQKSDGIIEDLKKQ